MSSDSHCRWKVSHSVILTSKFDRQEHVSEALSTMRKKSPDNFASIMVDCSHGNSSKNHLNQPKVAAEVAKQIADGETGIVGMMLVVDTTSHVVARLINTGLRVISWAEIRAVTRGGQILSMVFRLLMVCRACCFPSCADGRKACVDWEMTVDMLDDLNQVSRLAISYQAVMLVG